jgi:predicted 2-oxoglutarate/Fe(II)-dependent dioxygenase YbiX
MNPILKENNYLYLQNFIESDRATALATSFIKYANENNLTGDTQYENSQSSYNYHGFLELLCEKAPEISTILGEPVLPTYAYARVYKNGGELVRHKDREACEISVTLHLTGDTAWPISIQKPNGEEVSLNLTSGEAMMYLGNEADHWRDTYQGEEYVQVFLHYVRSRGENAWAVFDKDRTRPEDFVSVEQKEKLSRVYKKNIEDYIVEFENIVPPELCDAILAEYGSSLNWQDTQIGNGVVDKSIRNVKTIQMSQQYVIQQNPEVRQRLDEELFKCAAKAIEKYNQLFPEAMIEEDTGYELLKYGEGHFYTQHTDSFKSRPRAVSCSFALNDDYGGGAFAFFNKEFFYKLRKGSVLLFPSNFMYPHEVLPVTEGTRYSIITWFI